MIIISILGIAYAILTGVDPVYGLYSCFFGVLFYMLFGTSRHVSVGTMAVC
jgi:MFS superfamily sulfate permease-like transporter